MRERPILVPDLHMPDVPIVVMAWLARVGDRVVEGDRLVEIVAGEVSWEIDSPATGVLWEKSFDVESHVEQGQVLGIVHER